MIRVGRFTMTCSSAGSSFKSVCLSSIPHPKPFDLDDFNKSVLRPAGPRAWPAATLLPESSSIRFLSLFVYRVQRYRQALGECPIAPAASQGDDHKRPWDEP